MGVEMSKSLHRIIGLALLCLLAAGCSRQEEARQPPVRHAAKQAGEVTGEALFIERCRECHGVRQKGGVIGPDLSKIGSSRERAYLEQVIREPSQVFPGTAMPRYDTLSRKQVDSLVDYLETLN